MRRWRGWGSAASAACVNDQLLLNTQDVAMTNHVVVEEVDPQHHASSDLLDHPDHLGRVCRDHDLHVLLDHPGLRVDRRDRRVGDRFSSKYA